MRVTSVFALLLGATSAVALAQDARNSTRSSDPQHGGVRADAQSTTSTTTTTESSPIVSGTVVRYEPGRTIVVRDATNRERTFNLGPGVTLPVDIHVGAQVDLATESNGVNVTRVSSGTGAVTGGNGSATLPSAGVTGTSGTATLPNAGTTTTTGSTDSGSSYSTSGAQTGTSGTTTGTPMSGSTDAGSSYSSGATGVQGTTTETTSTTTSSATKRTGQLPKTASTTTTTWVSGTVTAYTPGQSVTISMPGGTAVEYRVDSSSTLPSDLAIGRTVKIHSDAGIEGSQPLARQVTYTKTTTTHHKKVTSQR